MSLGSDGGEIGLKVSGLGSQLSLYTATFLPFPIRHLSPFLMTCLFYNILIHINEGLEPVFALKKLEFL